ncbi:MAG: glucokinase, partial [Candidatus Binataceae bacterium]
MILAGDIGGTNSRLALFEAGGKQLVPIVEDVFPSTKYRSLDEIVAAFVLSHRLPIERACLGVAGPIRDGRAEPVNLPWIIDQRQLAATLRLEAIDMINDLEATAYGISALEPHDFAVLNQGAPEAIGNAAVIAAGTGLGEAGLYWDGVSHRPFATEG